MNAIVIMFFSGSDRSGRGRLRNNRTDVGRHPSINGGRRIDRYFVANTAIVLVSTID
jgi:hypothetical protein